MITNMLSHYKGAQWGWTTQLVLSRSHLVALDYPPASQSRLQNFFEEIVTSILCLISCVLFHYHQQNWHNLTSRKCENCVQVVWMTTPSNEEFVPAIFSAASQNLNICSRNSRLHGFFWIADLRNLRKLTGKYPLLCLFLQSFRFIVQIWWKGFSCR